MNMNARHLATLALALALTVPITANAKNYSDYIGTWVGVWTENRGQTEIRIDRIDQKGYVHGAMCQFYRGSAKMLYDFGPDAHIEPRHRGRTISFRIELPNGLKSRWRLRWVPRRDGLQLAYRSRTAPSADFLMTRYPSKCIDRWRSLGAGETPKTPGS